MNDNLGDVSIYEDALSNFNTKMQSDNNINDTSNYDICNDYKETNENLVLINNVNTTPKAQTVFIKIKGEDNEEYLVAAQNTEELKNLVFKNSYKNNENVTPNEVKQTYKKNSGLNFNQQNGGIYFYF